MLYITHYIVPNYRDDRTRYHLYNLRQTKNISTCSFYLWNIFRSICDITEHSKQDRFIPVLEQNFEI